MQQHNLFQYDRMAGICQVKTGEHKSKVSAQIDLFQKKAIYHHKSHADTFIILVDVSVHMLEDCCLSVIITNLLCFTPYAPRKSCDATWHARNMDSGVAINVVMVSSCRNECDDVHKLQISVPCLESWHTGMSTWDEILYRHRLGGRHMLACHDH